MFTGLVADLGEVLSLTDDATGVRLEVGTKLGRQLSCGDSISVNGVCLTATATGPEHFAADVMAETVRHSSLATLPVGALVNLELPLRAQDRLGGHVVAGHVDGVGTILDVAEDGFATRVTVEAPSELLRYLVVKGSVAVDGVSLTVTALSESSFDVALVPETLRRTNLGGAHAGRSVNLEVDVLAKYVERLTQAGSA